MQKKNMRDEIVEKKMGRKEKQNKDRKEIERSRNIYDVTLQQKKSLSVRNEQLRLATTNIV